MDRAALERFAARKQEEALRREQLIRDVDHYLVEYERAQVQLNRAMRQKDNAAVRMLKNQHDNAFDTWIDAINALRNFEQGRL